MSTRDVCKDCIAEGRPSRPLAAGAPGPRCTTHWRIEKKRRKQLAHNRLVISGYEMTPEQYQLLYAFQRALAAADGDPGVCFICRKATGEARHLAVEHEHNLDGCTHPPDRGCARCWRGLVCKRCNRLVAFLDVNALARAIMLLVDPPARRLFLIPPTITTCPVCHCPTDICEVGACPGNLDVIYEGPMEDTTGYWEGTDGGR